MKPFTCLDARSETGKCSRGSCDRMRLYILFEILLLFMNNFAACRRKFPRRAAASRQLQRSPVRHYSTCQHRIIVYVGISINDLITPTHSRSHMPPISLCLLNKNQIYFNVKKGLSTTMKTQSAR